MLQRITLPAQIRELGDDEVEVTMMTGALARDGHIIVPRGMDLSGYRSNPIVLWQHDPACPVGRATAITVGDDEIKARVSFAPVGISAKADEIRGLVKAGIVGSVSIGFDIDECEPIDPKKPRGGQLIVKSELLECSFVSVPADTGAIVTARDLATRARATGEDWKCGAARDLPIEDGDPAWDGSAAQAAIFEWAGGDEFDSAKARQGFLAYDASAPDKRGSYKLPFVHIVDGKLEVPKSALRAASGAHGVEAAQIGDAKDEAAKALDHYKEKAGIGEHAATPAATRTAPLTTLRQRAKSAAKTRGMYGVANLAWLLDCLNDAKSMARWEAEIEGDDSAVPAQLAACVKELGAVLVAMTEEEVAELLAGDPGDEIADHMEIMMMAVSPMLKRVFATSAARALSKANNTKLNEADDQLDRALGHNADAVDAHGSMEDRRRGLEAAHSRAADAHQKLGAALDAGDLDEAKKQHERMKRNLDAIGDHNTGLGDDHEAMGDAHRGVARSVRAAQRGVRSVAGPAEPGVDAEDDNPMAGEHSASLTVRQNAKRALMPAAAD